MAALLTNQNTDGPGPTVSLTGPSTVSLYNSTPGGAQVNLEYSINGTDWVPAAMLRTLGAITFNCQGAYFMRANVISAGAATNLNCEVLQ